MKRIVSILILALGAGFYSCNDGEVDIISLNTFGSVVCRNDQVRVFVSVETNSVTDNKYTRECTGGEFTNPPGLFENVWQAPDQPGTYELSVTVKCNGAKQTRTATMTVTDEYFYTDFETPYYATGWSSSGATLAQQSNGSLSYIATNNSSYFRRNIPDGLAPPYSMQVSYNPGTDAATHQLTFVTNMARVVGAEKYITRVRLVTYPATGDWFVDYRYYDIWEADDNADEDFPGVSGTSPYFEASMGWRNIAISIDADNVYYVYIDGQEIVRTDYLQTLARTEGFRYTVSSAQFTPSNGARIYLDDMFIMDNGEIMKGTARQR